MFKFLCTLSAVSVLLLSCNKDKVTGSVNVRLENATTETFDSVSVGSSYFGQLQPGSITPYHSITEPIYAGYCSYKKDSISQFAGVGVCGTPLPPAFEKGFYTFKIEVTTSGYNTVVVVKE